MDEDVENGDSSQRDVNEALLRCGDVDVAYAPLLPFLTAPVKPSVRAPFKLPEGVVRDDTVPRKTLGARRRKKPSPNTAFRLPVAQLDDDGFETLLEAPEPPAPAPVAAAAPEPTAAPFEPLILWEAPPDFEGGGPPVEVDPVLCRVLRQHQREGLQFIWDCVHGLKPHGGFGCILADDMGLGKSLQSVALMLTVLRQGMKGTPTARRIIVVCPTSLVANWDKEIVKWVGNRIKSIPIAEATRDKAILDINTFMSSREYQVLIISYETFRIHAPRFHARPDSCDLLICDEAHRLKNDATLTNRALAGLACKRRVLLSGTPMQNDLGEFFAMCDFTNPGVFGDAANFHKKYEAPILAAREPWATDNQKKTADAASAELSEIVNQFILRRTNSLLSKHLPPKLVQVVCVKMTDLQRGLYEHFLSSKVLSLLMSGKNSGVLSSITALRKLVNHPKLIYDALKAQGGGAAKKDEGAAGFEGCEDFFPENFHRERSACAEMSGKFELMSRMLTQLRASTTDRIVIVSCYTQTLDLFTVLCREKNFPVIRLDGSTSAGKRQKLVDQFNDPKNDEFVFLLSSKAGGCGLNIIGANRLVLFDPDWNPATDLQAAARVWRDGQKKKCFIYRLLATGTLEEKVFQRQLSKKGLQTIVVEEGEEVNTISTEDLRELFVINNDTPSDTHDTLRCTRCLKDEIREGDSDDEIDETKREQGSMALGAAALATSSLGAAGPPVIASVLPGDASAGGDGGLVDSRPAKCVRAAGDACVEVVLDDLEDVEDAGPRSVDIPAQTAMSALSGAATTPAANANAISLLSDDDDVGSDHGSHAGRRVSGGRGAGGSGGKKRGRGGSPSAPKAAKAISKAALKRAEKAEAVERKVFEAAYAAEMRSRLSVKLPPVPTGTTRRQLKYPTEDNLAHWSHHCGCDTVADPILAACGNGLVSFTFGLEVVGKDPSEFAPPPATARVPSTASGGFRSHGSAAGGGGSGSASAGAAAAHSRPAAAAPAPAARPPGSSSSNVGGALKRLGGPVRRPAGLSVGGGGGGFKAPVPAGLSSRAAAAPPPGGGGGPKPAGRGSGRAAGGAGGGRPAKKAAPPLRRRGGGSEEEEEDDDSGESEEEEEEAPSASESDGADGDAAAVDDEEEGADDAAASVGQPQAEENATAAGVPPTKATSAAGAAAAARPIRDALQLLGIPKGA